MIHYKVHGVINETSLGPHITVSPPTEHDHCLCDVSGLLDQCPMMVTRCNVSGGT